MDHGLGSDQPTKTLKKETKMKEVGNSVSPPQAFLSLFNEGTRLLIIATVGRRGEGGGQSYGTRMETKLRLGGEGEGGGGVEK